MDILYKRKNLLIVIGVGAILVFFAFLMPRYTYESKFDDDPRYVAEVKRYGFIGDRSKVKITFNGKKIGSGSFNHPWDGRRQPSVSFYVSPYTNELEVTVKASIYTNTIHPKEIRVESETYSVRVQEVSLGEEK